MKNIQLGALEGQTAMNGILFQASVTMNDHKGASENGLGNRKVAAVALSPAVVEGGWNTPNTQCSLAHSLQATCTGVFESLVRLAAACPDRDIRPYLLFSMLSDGLVKLHFRTASH